MGDTGNTSRRPDRPDDRDHPAHALLVGCEGATVPGPPAPPDCPDCGLRGDRYPTGHPGCWVLLEPRILVPAHTVPPRRRWIITSTGTAMNLWDAEPLPGTGCRLPHRLACPAAGAEEPWSWIVALRRHNDLRAQRLFDLPDEDVTGAG
ncbi:DUF6083 domain-containing protein [Kitasatospora cinereorecta]|uniref:DUF6083 domain-containing protein n=1 Tax=Streptomyces sp. NPDC057429 TaxID=3346130 RepID=UPI0033834B4F